MLMIQEIDYGTRPVTAEATVTLTIDGRAVRGGVSLGQHRRCCTRRLG